MPSASWAVKPSTLKFAYWLGLGFVTYVFFIRLCGLIFACGCLNLWDGGADHCNIHQAHVKHCPICELPSYAYNAMIFSIIAAQGQLVRRGAWLWAALAFPLLALAGSLVLGCYRGYWTGSGIANH